jgi:hypothetical protein
MEKSTGEFDYLDQSTKNNPFVIDVTYESDSDVDSMKQVYDKLSIKRLRSDQVSSRIELLKIVKGKWKFVNAKKIFPR